MVFLIIMEYAIIRIAYGLSTDNWYVVKCNAIVAKMQRRIVT